MVNVSTEVSEKIATKNRYLASSRFLSMLVNEMCERTLVFLERAEGLARGRRRYLAFGSMQFWV